MLRGFYYTTNANALNLSSDSFKQTVDELSGRAPDKLTKTGFCNFHRRSVYFMLTGSAGLCQGVCNLQSHLCSFSYKTKTVPSCGTDLNLINVTQRLYFVIKSTRPRRISCLSCRNSALFEQKEAEDVAAFRFNLPLSCSSTAITEAELNRWQHPGLNYKSSLAGLAFPSFLSAACPPLPPAEARLQCPLPG